MAHLLDVLIEGGDGVDTAVDRARTRKRHDQAAAAAPAVAFSDGVGGITAQAGNLDVNGLGGGGTINAGKKRDVDEADESTAATATRGGAAATVPPFLISSPVPSALVDGKRGQ